MLGGYTCPVDTVEGLMLVIRLSVIIVVIIINHQWGIRTKEFTANHGRCM